jgi:hypothetical protein
MSSAVIVDLPNSTWLAFIGLRIVLSSYNTSKSHSENYSKLFKDHELEFFSFRILITFKPTSPKINMFSNKKTKNLFILYGFQDSLTNYSNILQEVQVKMALNKYKTLENTWDIEIVKQ